ncbi:NAD-dependent protein deacylase [Syntrophobacter sp. SbD1]|nr:NAD-dependent protein deacylase [Syntrophobacter sp. SbD1]
MSKIGEWVSGRNPGGSAENRAEAGIKELKEKLWWARHVTVLTGAGISAESGVPTFRGEGGLWKQFRAVDLATPEAFSRNPKLVWEFYNWRRELLAPLSPNPGHFALAEIERRVPHFTLITQNIDGLHEKAGSCNIIELHGNIWKVRCTRCQRVLDDRRVPLPEMPACESCGSLLRPHVVWFGEMLEPQVLNAAYEAIGNSDLMIVTGTSGTVQPAASMGVQAKRNGASVAEINFEPTPLSNLYDISILGKSGEILPQLL